MPNHSDCAIPNGSDCVVPSDRDCTIFVYSVYEVLHDSACAVARDKDCAILTDNENLKAYYEESGYASFIDSEIVSSSQSIHSWLLVSSTHTEHHHQS